MTVKIIQTYILYIILNNNFDPDQMKAIKNIHISVLYSFTNHLFWM